MSLIDDRESKRWHISMTMEIRIWIYKLELRFVDRRSPSFISLFILLFIFLVFDLFLNFSFV